VLPAPTFGNSRRDIDRFDERMRYKGTAPLLEETRMTRVPLGVLLGLAVGAVDVLLMLPLDFPDKRSALLGAFCARFALGFFAATVRIPLSPVASGIIVGILTSAPDAIITKAYAPILVTGIIFGAVAGWIVGRWARTV
jgi:hypothetical protein